MARRSPRALFRSRPGKKLRLLGMNPRQWFLLALFLGAVIVVSLAGIYFGMNYRH